MRLLVIHAFAILASCSSAALAQTPSATEYKVTTANSQPNSITAGPDGALWFTEPNAHKIGRITTAINGTAGNVTEFPVPPSYFSEIGPNSIALGPDQALWFTTDSHIGRITTGGSFSSFPGVSGGIGFATAITNGPDNALWFIDIELNVIARITTSGTVKTFAPPTNVRPNSIVTGPDRNLWFTASTNQVGFVTTAGVFKTFPLSAGSSPSGITVGPGAKLWFTETGSSKIGSITTGGTLSEFPLPPQKGPNQIAAGSDGALWFTETNLSRVGRIMTGNDFSEVTNLTPNSFPVGIALGPDGAIWFTETGVNFGNSSTTGSGMSKIGTIKTVPAPTLTSINPTSATACGPAFNLTLTGSNYQNNTVGVFGGDPAILSGIGLSTFVNSSIQLQATVTPALIATPGPYGVYAATPVGSQYLVSGSIQFQVKRTPVIQQISPTNVVAGAGTQLTVVISNYIPNVTTVFFGQTSLPVVSAVQQGSNTAVTVSVGASLTSTPGPVPVNVLNVEDANPNRILYSPVSCSPPQTVTVTGQLTITTPSLPTGTVGVAYTPFTLQAQGGTGSLTWSATGLPANLTIGPANGVLSGTPNAAGSYTVTVNVSDSSTPKQTASRTYTLVVNAGLTITTPSLPSGTAGVAYTPFTLQAQGGAGSLGWSAMGLPANLTIGSTNGVLSGTPNTAGSYTVTVNVSDSSTPKQTASRTYTLIVNAGLTITTAALPNGTVGVAYTPFNLQAQGGTGSLAWSATGLPGTLTLGPTNGVLSGTPNIAGSYTVSVNVSDNSTPKQTASRTYTLIVNAGLSILTTALPNGTPGVAYTPFTLQAQGGTGSLTWSATGLPATLTLGPTNGVLSGTPNAAGNYTVMVTVTDGRQSKLQTYSLTIGLPALPSIQLSVNKQPASITDQVGISSSLSSSYAYPLTGTYTLSFTPNAAGLPASGYSAPGLQFASPLPNTGGLQTSAPVPSGSVPVQQGSVAGTITATLTGLTANVNGQNMPVPLPSSAPVTTISVPRLAPSIVPGSVRIINVSSAGFTVDLHASSTPRDLTSATVTFMAASGTQLNGTSFDVPLTASGTAWFASADGQSAGGTFDLQLPFKYSGDTSAIGGVSVTLRNSVGTSAAVSGTR
jgi:streptogramin lyase